MGGVGYGAKFLFLCIYMIKTVNLLYNSIILNPDLSVRV